MKKLILTTILTVFLLAGCHYTPSYHESFNKQWIQEQVEKGYLTEEQAKQLLEQDGQ